MTRKTSFRKKSLTRQNQRLITASKTNGYFTRIWRSFLWYGEHAHALGARHLLSHSQVTCLDFCEWAVSTQQIYEAEEESSIEQEHESVRREEYCGSESNVNLFEYFLREVTAGEYCDYYSFETFCLRGETIGVSTFF
jgi:hypothetical protein